MSHIDIATLPRTMSAFRGENRTVALFVRLSKVERATLAALAHEHAYEPSQLVRAMILDVIAGRVPSKLADPRQLGLPVVDTSPRGERKSRRASASKGPTVKRAAPPSRKTTPTPRKRKVRK